MLQCEAFDLSGESYKLHFDLYVEIENNGHEINVFSLWGDFLGVVRVDGCGQVVSVEKEAPFYTCDDFGEIDDEGDPLTFNARDYTALDIARALNVVVMFLNDID